MRVGGSQRELSRRSGLTEVHVGQIIRKLEKDPAARIEQATLDAIARGAGVQGAWLSHGVGTPDDTQLPPSTVPDDAQPVNASVPGWDDAVALAKLAEPDLPDAAIERAGKAARLLTTAQASPELVIQLAKMALRFGGTDMFEAVRAEGLARQERRRELVDAGVDVPGYNELTEAGKQAVAEGRLKPGPRATYRGAGAHSKPKAESAANERGEKK